MPSHRFPTPAPRRGQRTTPASPSAADGDKARKRQNNFSKFTPKREADSPKREPQKTAAAPGFRDTAPPDEAHVDPAPVENSNDTFLQPGIKPVTELLQTSPEKVDAVFVRKGRKGKETGLILDLCRKANVRFSLVDDTQLDRLWSGRHQGVIARLFATGFTDFEDLLALAVNEPLPLIVALDQVQDPGNAGALARTLYALGGAGLVVPRHNGVYLGAAAARVAAGALDKLAVAKAANLAQALDAALDAGYTVYGADSAAALSQPGGTAENVFDFVPRLPAVLVLGSEEGGLRPIIRKRCSAFLSIPFAREFDSLNVAQAGAVIISAFAAARQARK